LIYTDPKLAPGGAGPGDPVEGAPPISAYTGLNNDVPPPPGWNGPSSGVPGLYAPDNDAPAIPSPALFPGAPIPGPPRIVSNIPPAAPATVDGMLLPPSPAPNVPLLPAEGTP
jgi:phospholipid/cholesterol/gamma-HCH transport system substrate-binding protein